MKDQQETSMDLKVRLGSNFKFFNVLAKLTLGAIFVKVIISAVLDIATIFQIITAGGMQ